MNRIAIAAAAAVLMGIGVGAKAQTEAPVPPFVDVPKDHWAYQAVENLRQKGILRGYPDTNYRGKRTITRFETAVALDRVLRAVQNAPREGLRGPAGPRGPQGPKGERGPHGEPGTNGVAPPEVADFQAALEGMRKQIGSLRQELDTADKKVGSLADETAKVKKDARPFRTVK